MLSAIAVCLHDLQPYANDHWLDHLIALLDPNAMSSIPANELLPLRRGLEQLASRHNDILLSNYGDSIDEHDIAASQESLWNPLELSAPVRSLLDKTLQHRRKRSLNKDLVMGISCMWLQMPPLELL